MKAFTSEALTLFLRQTVFRWLFQHFLRARSWSVGYIRYFNFILEQQAVGLSRNLKQETL